MWDSLGKSIASTITYFNKCRTFAPLEDQRHFSRENNEKNKTPILL